MKGETTSGISATSTYTSGYKALVATRHAATYPGSPMPLTVADLVTDRALTDVDEDRLDHAPIAARVVDLLDVSEPPVSVALFGAWGSGKSSFARLVKREISGRSLDIRVVIYNAWTFSGESLQRNFISHTAAELGVNREKEPGRSYYQGMYEHQRSAHLNLSVIDWNGLLLLAALVLAGMVLAVILFVGSLAAVLGKDPIKAAQDTIPSVLASSAVTALLIAGVKQILDGARVDTDQGAPTEEQLHDLFLNLVRDETKPRMLGGPRRRILFFIDELDRCPRAQIVETLAAIRGYLEAPGSLFVVAADRQVMERAFDRLPYPNPADVENPYYSSASEFFDKVFQYQVALPPLRGDTLLRFAHDLVADRTAGVWHELHAIDTKSRLLDQVLYDLIPSHVRSPRRIKVLLNAFATNVRIADARGLEWLSRSEEIAKLTALQTEFPLFANDLLLEPHLPTYLLEPPDKPSPRLVELLRKHELGVDPSMPFPKVPAVQPAGSSAATVTPTPPDISAVATVAPTDRTPRTTEQEGEALAVAQRRLLRSYLVRVAQVSDPRRDLLYLSSAGVSVDLDDTELAQAIEEIAVDDPASVVDMAASKGLETRIAGIRLLAALILQRLGRERTNLVAAMLGIATSLDYEIGSAADDASNALGVVARQEGLEDGYLVPAFAVALRAAPKAGESLADELLVEPRLIGNPTGIEQVAAWADRLPPDRRPKVWATLGDTLEVAVSVVDVPLRTLPSAVADEMLSAITPQIHERIEELSSPDASVFVESLFDAVADRADDAALGGRLVLICAETDTEPIYAVLRARAPGIIGGMPSPDAEKAALWIFVDAPPDDWELWTSLLADAPRPSLRAIVMGALKHALAVTDAIEKEVDLAAIVRRLVPMAIGTEPVEAWGALEDPVNAAIAARPWAKGQHDAQVKVYLGLLELAPLGEGTRLGVATLIGDQLANGLASASAEFPIHAINEVASVLPLEALAVAAPALKAAVVTTILVVDKVAAQIAVASRLRTFGDPSAITLAEDVMPDVADVLPFATTNASVFGSWLVVPPPFADVEAAAIALASAAQSVRILDGFGLWASKSNQANRTDLLIDVLDATDDASRWIEAVAPHGVDGRRVALEVCNRVRKATTAPRRRELARSLIALKPAEQQAQQAIAQLMLDLLARQTQVDVDVAASLARALGRGHQAGRRLGDAFESVLNAGFSIPSQRLEDLRAAGVPIKKQSLLSRLAGRKRRS